MHTTLFKESKGMGVEHTVLFFPFFHLQYPVYQQKLSILTVKIYSFSTQQKDVLRILIILCPSLTWNTIQIPHIALKFCSYLFDLRGLTHPLTIFSSRVLVEGCEHAQLLPASGFLCQEKSPHSLLLRNSQLPPLQWGILCAM